MRKIIIIALICLVIPLTAAAKDLRSLKFQVSENIKADCHNAIEVLGCFNFHTNTIIINSNIPPQSLSNVVWHKVGHYLMWDMPITELRTVFPTVNYIFTDAQWKELMPTYFAYWITHPAAFDSATNSFFWKLLK